MTSSSTPPPSMPHPLPSLTLVVATTPSLGIGLRGSLPWPPLKPDLAFFARVTKRPPPQHVRPSPPHPQRRVQNAVIMGRKTWESLPAKARPLKGRVNVVVSRNLDKLDLSQGGSGEGGVMGVGSLEEGLRRLQEGCSLGLEEVVGRTDASRVEGGQGEGSGREEEQESQERVQLGRVFVIGGAAIYRCALGMGCCERILWTRLKGEWECDVYFPKGVMSMDGEAGGCGEYGRWVRRETEELEKWVGEEGVGGLKKEGETEFEVCMLERDGS